MNPLPNTITLCGFSGAGKTTIAELFAERHPNYSFIDLDSYIEEKYSKTVSEIFALQGESMFREYEFSTLNEIFNNSKKGVSNSCKKIIISLGGGSLTLDKTRELVKRESFCIYLKCSPEVLAERIAEEKEREKRPLIKSSVTKGANLAEWVSVTLSHREPLYLESAIGQIDTTIWDEEKIVCGIEEILTRNAMPL